MFNLKSLVLAYSTSEREKHKSTLAARAGLSLSPPFPTPWPCYVTKCRLYDAPPQPLKPNPFARAQVPLGGPAQRSQWRALLQAKHNQKETTSDKRQVVSKKRRGFFFPWQKWSEKILMLFFEEHLETPRKIPCFRKEPHWRTGEY